MGVELGAYSFQEFKTKKDDKNNPLETAKILVTEVKNNQKIFEEAQIIAESVLNVRNLVNTPPSHMYPSVFADYVKKSFRRGSKVSLEILDEKMLKKKGYGALIGVGQGSINPPRFVRTTYKVKGAKFQLALVGKGITFDTGGISLKPPASMHTMKCDMAGAATVIETLRAIAKLDLKINVTAYAALAENMPSATAQRPSDVVTTYSGKTIEVLNTDAEGRLVLADALGRAQEDKPDLIVDVATLTGAATIALGSRTAGIMSNKDDARDQVFASAKEAGESMWPMQIPEEIRAVLDSKTADIANVGFTPNPAGGMMLGAAFLKEFVDEKTAWVHLDIAPPAFNEGAAYGYTNFGGTGVGVRTLVNLAQKLSNR
jgi:leucyl aminopeptidase